MNLCTHCGDQSAVEDGLCPSCYLLREAAAGLILQGFCAAIDALEAELAIDETAA